MKFDRTSRFLADYRRLSQQERRLFIEAVHRMIEASRHEPGVAPRWPASLRIRPISGVRGIYEMTWSFSGPDGRATFEYAAEEGELLLRWRRIGGHEIFREP